MSEYGILIPALNPDEKLLSLVSELLDSGLDFSVLVIVDDGSDDKHQVVFDQLMQLHDARIQVLHHQQNKGKGMALKTGFKFILQQYPATKGIATMDADGQHTVLALIDCLRLFERNLHSLVIGVRQFTNKIPLRSRLGNILTRKLVKLTTHQNISDTQTGLRIIPQEYIEKLIDFPGERFEFEFDMLLKAAENQVTVLEQTIPTIYLDGNKSSHFRVIQDSLSIYARFLKFALSGLISFIVDIALFEMVLLLIGNYILDSILIATIVSRGLSAMVNYTLNHQVVFNGNGKQPMIKYGILFIIQMLVSGYFTGMVTELIASQGHWAPMLAKILVDFTLFMISYRIQKNIVFKSQYGD